MRAPLVTTLGAWLLLGACGGDPELPAVPAIDLVQPLEAATSSPWRQQVWFVARADETIETLALDAHQTPVVMLVSADGTRRAVRLDGPGRASETQYSARPGARASLTGSTADDSLRVAVVHEDVVTVTVTDTRGGGGRQVLVRDVPERRLAHPTVDPEKAAVYVGEVGELGGIYRIGVGDEAVARIVPESNASTPVAWRSPDGERIVYVEDGTPAKVVVAEPVSGLPPRPAVEMLREGKLPQSLVRVAEAPGGQLLQVVSCAPEPPLSWTAPTDDVLRLEGHEDLGFGRAIFCGRGCTELLTGSPEGATRLAARFEQDPARDLWRVWFAPDLAVSGGLMVTPEKGATVPEVPACLPPLDPEVWLVEPIWHGSPQRQPTHLHTAGDTISAYGVDDGRAFIVTLSDKRVPFERTVGTRREPPEPGASTADGAARARVADGGVVWTEVATGATSQVLPPDPTRVLVDPAFDENGAILYVADHGAEPGLLRLALHQGTMSRVVALGGLRGALPLDWDGSRRVALIRDVGDESRILTARPFDEAMRRAWNEGPMTLVPFTPVWVPVQREEGRLERCEAPDRVEIGVDAEGGFLRWGDVRTPARAAYFDGQYLEILGEQEGVPVVLAELRLDGRSAHWFPRALNVPRRAASWAPAEEAEALPRGGRCDPRRE